MLGWRVPLTENASKYLLSVRERTISYACLRQTGRGRRRWHRSLEYNRITLWGHEFASQFDLQERVRVFNLSPLEGRHTGHYKGSMCSGEGCAWRCLQRGRCPERDGGDLPDIFIERCSLYSKRATTRYCVSRPQRSSFRVLIPVRACRSSCISGPTAMTARRSDEDPGYER